MADIEAGGNLRAVQRVDIADEFINIGAGVSHDTVSQRVFLEHIFHADLDALLCGIGNQPAIVIHIQLKNFFLMAVIENMMDRGDDDHLCA